MMRISVGIVVYQNKVLLIKRKNQEGNLLWQFPAGKIMQNEDSAHAAIREIWEETNVTCRIVKKIGERTHPETLAELHYRFCEYIDGEAVVNAADEVSDVKWCEKDEVFTLITSNIFPVLEVFIRKEL